MVGKRQVVVMAVRRGDFRCTSHARGVKVGDMSAIGRAANKGGQSFVSGIALTTRRIECYFLFVRNALKSARRRNPGQVGTAVEEFRRRGGNPRGNQFRYGAARRGRSSPPIVEVESLRAARQARLLEANGGRP